MAQTLEEIFKDCKETDWAWNGEDEYPVDIFNDDKATQATRQAVETAKPEDTCMDCNGVKDYYDNLMKFIEGEKYE